MTWLVPPAARRAGQTRRVGRAAVQAVVVHATRTRTLDAALRWLLSPETRVGGHLVIGTGGEVVQLAPLSDRVPHAGRATWRGRPANAVALAVWLVGPGLLARRADRIVDPWSTRWDGLVVAAPAESYPALAAERARLAIDPSESLLWARLPEAQVASLEWVASLLTGLYPVLGARDAMPGEPARWCSDDALADAARVGLGPVLPIARLRAAGAGI